MGWLGILLVIVAELSSLVLFVCGGFGFRGCHGFGLVFGLVFCFCLFEVCGKGVCDLGLLWLYVEIPWSHVGFP